MNSSRNRQKSESPPEESESTPLTEGIQRYVGLVLSMYRDESLAMRKLYAASAICWWAWKLGWIPHFDSRPWLIRVDTAAASLAVGIVGNVDRRVERWLVESTTAVGANHRFLVRVGKDKSKLPEPSEEIRVIDLRG
jgi:hypothetical protein